MRIALITETFPPEVNGVAMTLGRLTKGMVARGHSLQVVRPRQAGEASAPAGPDVVVAGAPIPGYGNLRFGWPAGRRLRRLWRESPPDLVHVATEGPLGWSAVRAAKRLGLPTSSSYHTNFDQYSGHYRMAWARSAGLAYLRWFHNQTLATFAPTRAVCDGLEKNGIHSCRVLGRGVDGDLFHPRRRSESLRREWGAEPEDPVVLYVGRLAAEKNLPLAARAFQAMREREPKARFVLVGDGPLAERWWREYPDFIYAGPRRGEDLGAHYASADLFLFPSVTETYGNVVMEAMAAGLPAVAYRYAAAAEHGRDGGNGFFAKFGDEKDFIDRAVSSVPERTRWREMGRAARQTAGGLTWEKVCETWERDLLNILEVQSTESSTHA